MKIFLKDLFRLFFEIGTVRNIFLILIPKFNFPGNKLVFD